MLPVTWNDITIDINCDGKDITFERFGTGLATNYF